MVEKHLIDYCCNIIEWIQADAKHINRLLYSTTKNKDQIESIADRITMTCDVFFELLAALEKIQDKDQTTLTNLPF